MGEKIYRIAKQLRARIAKEIVAHVKDASLREERVFTRDEVVGWLSIVGIYLTVGIILSLPFLILGDKLFAWLVSNLCGSAWLFLYGVKIGKLRQKQMARWANHGYDQCSNFCCLLYNRGPSATHG